MEQAVNGHFPFKGLGAFVVGVKYMFCSSFHSCLGAVSLINFMGYNVKFWISITGRQYPELMMAFLSSGDGSASEEGLLCAFPKEKLPSSAIEG